jgi:chitodextrinase
VKTNGKKTNVTLTWQAASDNFGVSFYRVLRNGSAVASNVTGTSFIDSLSQRGTFSYTVVAVDGAGNASAASNAVSVTKSR